MMPKQIPKMDLMTYCRGFLQVIKADEDVHLSDYA